MASGTIKNTNGFLIKQRLSAGSDLNDLIGYQYIGFYYVTTGVANAPESWTVILSIATSENAMKQFCFGGTSIYTRAYAGTPREWGPWVKFTEADTGWLSIVGTESNAETFIGTIYYRKIGNIVNVIGYALYPKAEIQKNSYIALCSLPDGYKPYESIGFSAMTNTNIGNVGKIFPAIVASGGTVYVYSNSDTVIATTTRINFSAMYFAK